MVVSLLAGVVRDNNVYYASSTCWRTLGMVRIEDNPSITYTNSKHVIHIYLHIVYPRRPILLLNGTKKKTSKKSARQQQPFHDATPMWCVCM